MMEIGKVTVRRVNMYDITVNGTVYKNFEKEGEWNGMVHFKSPQGSVIVHDAVIFKDLFTTLFGSPKDGEDQELSVAKISPELVPTDSED